MNLIDELRESGQFEGLKYTPWDSADVPKALDPKYEDTVAAIVFQDFLDFARERGRYSTGEDGKKVKKKV
ncbi:hypothetical protein Q3G72_020180 [Acer saccharum]|nr:hypothetical protein Q3G72_020180 [Acer saccharum]